jgi:hypothetical protein
MGERKGWIDWRVFWTVLFVVVVVVPLMAFAAQRLITPGSAHESGNAVETVKTTERCQQAAGLSE